MADLKQLFVELDKQREELVGDIGALQYRVEKVNNLVDLIVAALHDELNLLIAKVNAI